MKILLAAQEEPSGRINAAIEPPHPSFCPVVAVDNSVAARTLSDPKIDYDKSAIVAVKGSTPANPIPRKTPNPSSRRNLESASQISRKRGDNDIGLNICRWRLREGGTTSRSAT